MRISGANGKSRPVRIPLEAASLLDAQKELEKRRTENRNGEMHLPGRRPTFEVLAADYQRSAQFLGKKLGTRQNEIQALNRWIAHLGGIRVDWIKADRMSDFRNRRKAEGVSARTINLDLVAFNNAMAYGVERGWLSAAPRLKKLKERAPAQRTLLAVGEIKRLLRACVPKVTKNARELKFYLRFLCLTGCREQEALKVRWSDVDLWNQQVTIGADADTKNSKHRIVNFTPELKELLHEMADKRPPDKGMTPSVTMRDHRLGHGWSALPSGGGRETGGGRFSAWPGIPGWHEARNGCGNHPDGNGQSRRRLGKPVRSTRHRPRSLERTASYAHGESGETTDIWPHRARLRQWRGISL